MGRITIFTVDDVLSHQVKALLKERGLPYTDISLDIHPSKREDVQCLSLSMSVPQVFFNTRCIGGVEQTKEELEQQWDIECSNETDYLHKYGCDIGRHKLSDKRLTLLVNASTLPSIPELKPPPFMSFELPDGKTTTTHDITEKIKLWIPAAEIKYDDLIYLDCFTDKSAMKQFKKMLKLSQVEVVAFWQYLLCTNFLHKVTLEKQYRNFSDNHQMYRLQCNHTPNILNSYCIWRVPVVVTHKYRTETILNDLDLLLHEIECKSTDEEGKVDHRVARNNKLYPAFEEAVCVLQKIDITGMEHDEMLAFALNIYRLMFRYALFKVGVPNNESARMKLLRAVRFNIGGYIFSLQEWVDGILRGNRRTRFRSKKPMDSSDPRIRFSLAEPDFRIHYAINIGAWLGSSVGLPFSRYSKENINQELDIAAHVFFEDRHNFEIDQKSGKFLISKPLMLYRSDFVNKDKDMLTVVGKYLLGKKKVKFINFNRKNNKKHWKVEFLDLDCARNASNYNYFNGYALGLKVKGFKEVIPQRFEPPEIHPRELARLSTLESLNILDTPAEERLDRITRMVQIAFNVPVVFVSLVGEDRQWFKSTQWYLPSKKLFETSRDVSCCGHAILQEKDDILQLEDLLDDNRFADNQALKGYGFRFYAGCVLSVPDVNNYDETVEIGTLCLLDIKPRKFSGDDRAKLRKFANHICDEILCRDNISHGFISHGLSDCTTEWGSKCGKRLDVPSRRKSTPNPRDIRLKIPERSLS